MANSSPNASRATRLTMSTSHPSWLSSRRQTLAPLAPVVAGVRRILEEGEMQDKQAGAGELNRETREKREKNIRHGKTSASKGEAGRREEKQ